MKNLTTLPLRSACALASAAILSFGLVACSDDTSEDAASTFTSTSSETSTSEESESNVSRDRDDEEETDEDNAPQPTLADEAGPEDSAEAEAETDPSDEATGEPSVNPCDLAATQSHFSNPLVQSCDGQFAVVAQMNSDARNLYMWNGSRWARYDAHDADWIGFPCWDHETLSGLGASPDVLSTISNCAEVETEMPEYMRR